MYEKNLLKRTGLTLEFEDGVTAFIEWSSLNMHIWKGRVQGYFEDIIAPPSQEEQTPAAHEEKGATDPRNVKLELCMNGFAPHEQYGQLEVDEKRPNVIPKVVYTLTKAQKRRIFEWISPLEFPDCYASNLASYVDMKELKMHGMKSHDCHIFMKKLILIVFHEMHLKSVWSALTEVNLLIQILCSTALDVNKVQESKGSVATILCNLEKIFLPTCFDSMEYIKSTMNHEMCVKSSSYIDTDSDFYGILEEIIQLDYLLIPNMHIILVQIPLGRFHERYEDISSM
ncbi:UNVERIFIED_CONTAM: hypothetical protein Scaly_2232600 [Sesamum calycinum]|uniref:Uncharacterized protein n=1 Tax=Sesamum calycinum TaxID=2727403 RepID=A0AAW2MBT3_9LAMI